MSDARVHNSKQWSRALVVAIGLLVVSLVLTAVAVLFSDWLYLYFCWGDILLASAIPIILLGLVTNGPFPSTEHWWEGAGWGLLMGVIVFALFAFAPYCCDTSDHMFTLACFGTMASLIAFAVGAAMRRNSIFMIAFASYFFWIILFPDEVTALILTVASLGAAAVLVYWLNQTYPLEAPESEMLTIEDILANPSQANFSGTEQNEREEWGDWVAELMSDPDEAMMQLEKMAQSGQMPASDKDDLQEKMMAGSVQKDDMFKGEKLLDKSSPAFLGIFTVMLILLLFSLIILAMFVR